VLLPVLREEEGAAQKGALMQQLGLVFQILLLVAIVAGIFTWDRRASQDRRSSNRAGRRTADGAAADTTEPTSG
jgi:hypothetical protein